MSRFSCHQKKVLIRVDGNKSIGMGHVYRQITLAKNLIHRLHVKPKFIVRNNKSVVNLLTRNLFDVQIIPKSASFSSEKNVLRKIMSVEKPDGVIVDLTGFDRYRSYMGSLKLPKSWILAFTDDPRKRIIDADVVISSDLAQQPRWYNHLKNTQYYFGLNYTLLDERYSNSKPKRKTSCKNVLICMGGADHHNLTIKVIGAIDQSRLDFKCDVVVNSSFYRPGILERLVRNHDHQFVIHYDAPGMFDFFSLSDMSITSGGLIHLERMAAGVPGISIDQIRRQEHLSQLIAQKGGTLSLGIYSRVTQADIRKSFDRLMGDRQLRCRIRENGLMIVDGKGLSRLGDIVASLMSRKEN